MVSIPSTGDTGEIVSGLWYANGVAIAHDEKSVLVRMPRRIPLVVSVIGYQQLRVLRQQFWVWILYVYVFFVLFLIRWWRRWGFVLSDTGWAVRRRDSQKRFLDHYLDFLMASPVVRISSLSWICFHFCLGVALGVNT